MSEEITHFLLYLYTQVTLTGHCNFVHTHIYCTAPSM